MPRDLATFTGRTRELERLTAMAEHDGGTTKVVAVDGMPGVGKTVLVVRLAHRLAARYPDGQIFLDLYGHDTENEPLAPAAALDQLLRLLGIPADRIPADLDGRAGLWRTELARRRVLLVLDNALGHDQIRRLLPGSPGCLVLITSRRRLSGLDAARAFSLDVLGPDEAALLLTRVAELSPDADPAAVATVARLCGHLPLALQLVGNRLRHRSSWTVADLTARLGADGRRLAELRAEERAVVTAFRLSYDGLDAVTRRAFRLLGLHPGAEVTAPDTAALLNTDRAQAEYLLDALHDHHLISEPKPGRYRFHDLIHEYARQLADRDPAPAREAALDRLLDHYLTTAEQADAALFPRSAAPSAFETADQARQWLDAELHNLLRAARHAADRGRHRHAALLARALRQYLEQQGPWSEAAVLHERAVQAWRTLGDDRQAALAMADLSRILLRAGHHEDSLHHATRGLRIGRALGDLELVATLLDQMGLLHWHRSEIDVAIGYYEQSLSTWQAIGNEVGEAEVRNHRSIALWHLGRYAEAADEMHAALALYEQAGDPQGRQMTLNNLGDVELHLGRYESALDYYERAAAVKEMGRQHMPAWLMNVGTVYRKTGRLDEALECYRRALSICRGIGDRRGEATSLNHIGAWYGQAERDGEALIHFQKALSISREIAEKYQEICALRNIAAVYDRTGRYGIALQRYEESLALARAIGDTYQEACALDGMAKVLARTHGFAHALPHWRRSYRLYEALGVPEAAEVRTRLSEPDGAFGSE
ncbi:ATP-binding protein [Actinomadura keratinilytica]|uniref:ATP-binding protein n=1 Tax=Actinomadura keratinilytica TaxID=547461 RepID=UPI0036196428